MTGLRTVSLRRRVTLTTLAVLGVVLVLVGMAVGIVFAAQAERGLNTLLAGRAQLAQQLARQNVPPPMLIRRIDARGVRVSLRLASGETLGSPPTENDREARQSRVTLTGPGKANGAELTLSADTSLLTGAQTTLRRILIITGLAALAVTALALLLSVRFALAPLDAMTRLARSIAAGRRGGRLAPARTDTELGRTAAAFDDMLDSLEGAERTARDSEDRTRRFVADAAHELRTPLAGIQAAAEAALQLPPDADPERRERLQLLLVRESRRAGKLVEDLLDLARLDAGVQLGQGEVNLLALAHAQAERLALLAPELSVRVEGEELCVPGDGDRIAQIIGNLAENARRATGGQGTLTVRIGRSDGCAEVLVTDDGPGVPEAERERIFDRLVRLDDARDRDRGGSGLGLPIARGFARAHGGDLNCQARPDGERGAQFRLRLPLG